MEQELWKGLGICPGDLVALSGGGARESSAARVAREVAVRVARELAAAGRSVVITRSAAFGPVPETEFLLVDHDASPGAPSKPTLMIPVADDPGADLLGFAGGSPAGARVVPLLSGGSTQKDGAATVRRLLGRPEIGRVVELNPQVEGSVGVVHRQVVCVVLAGGASRRFGGSKLLYPWQGRTILEASLQAALRSGLGEVLVVTGAYGSELARLLERYPVRVIPNPAWEEGMSTSLKAGLRGLQHDPPRGVMIFLGDQPLLPPHVPVDLANRLLATGAPVVAPVVQGQRRSPVLFDWTLVPELLELTGDEGGRQVVRRYAGQMELVEYTEEAWFRDIDTRGDLPEADA